MTPIDSKEMQYAMYQDQHFKEVAVEDANGNRCKIISFSSLTSSSRYSVGYFLGCWEAKKINEFNTQLVVGVSNGRREGGAGGQCWSSRV